MRSLGILFIFLSTFLCQGQTDERAIVNGRISVPAGDDPEGISVYNNTTNRGTVSTDNGEFVIRVALGDELVFSALQFQEFRVIIDQNVIDARELNVFISEATTELPEVVVRPFDLSGNVEVDLNRIPVAEPNFPNTAEFNDADWDFRPDSLTSPENAAMRTSMMRDGLNFANLFRRLAVAKGAGMKTTEPLEKEVRELYDDEFFREYFNIEREDIYDFLLFAEENGLSKEMLEEGNEMELVQFLMEQREKYEGR